jgi:DNA-binding phage protein
MNKYKTKNISSMKIPKVSEIDLSGFDQYESSIDFSNPKKVKQILVEHFLAGDEETFLEILGLYLNHVGKEKVSKKTKIPQRTIYNFISGDHKTSSENIFKVMKFISDEEDAA